MPLAERDFATVRVWFDHVAAERLPDVLPDDLKAAWAGLVAARARQPAPSRHARAAVGAQRDEPRAEDARAARYREFTTLFAEHADVAHLVVTFLALLELAREQLVRIAQTEPYAPIYVTLTGAPEFALAADD